MWILHGDRERERIKRQFYFRTSKVYFFVIPLNYLHKLNISFFSSIISLYFNIASLKKLIAILKCFAYTSPTHESIKCPFYLPHFLTQQCCQTSCHSITIVSFPPISKGIPRCSTVLLTTEKKFLTFIHHFKVHAISFKFIVIMVACHLQITHFVMVNCCCVTTYTPNKRIVWHPFCYAREFVLIKNLGNGARCCGSSL